MNVCVKKKYSGDGGNEQRTFIQDANFGWENIQNEPQRHLANGITQYEYLKSLGSRLGGQARCLLDNYIAKWDYKD